MARQQCPKGTLCLSWSMFAILMILGAFLYIFLKPFVNTMYQGEQNQGQYPQGKYPQGKHERMHQQPTPTYITVVTKGNGDDRYTRAPEAIRRPMYGQLPSLATRGDYGPYQQMGVLERGDGTFYPLFGRRTYHSDKFNYYTRTDTYNPVQLPIKFNKRDCTDDNGCNEISDGDAVRIGNAEEAKVKLYTSSFVQ